MTGVDPIRTVKVWRETPEKSIKAVNLCLTFPDCADFAQVRRSECLDLRAGSIRGSNAAQFSTETGGICWVEVEQKCTLISKAIKRGAYN